MKISVEVVELDPKIVEVARDYFGFVEDSRMSVIVADGLDRIRELASLNSKCTENNNNYDAQNNENVDDKIGGDNIEGNNNNTKVQTKQIIIIDVDSKDVSVGMSCPPRSFVEKEFLQSVRKTLDNEGVLMINLVCRSEKILSEVMETIKEVFDQIIEIKMEEDVNRIIFCFSNSLKRPSSAAELCSSFTSLQKAIPPNQKLQLSDEFIEFINSECKIITHDNPNVPKPNSAKKKKKKKKGKKR